MNIPPSLRRPDSGHGHNAGGGASGGGAYNKIQSRAEYSKLVNTVFANTVHFDKQDLITNNVLLGEDSCLSKSNKVYSIA